LFAWEEDQFRNFLEIIAPFTPSNHHDLRHIFCGIYFGWVMILVDLRHIFCLWRSIINTFCLFRICNLCSRIYGSVVSPLRFLHSLGNLF
jgi:hypothetical protein